VIHTILPFIAMLVESAPTIRRLLDKGTKGHADEAIAGLKAIFGALDSFVDGTMSEAEARATLKGIADKYAATDAAFDEKLKDFPEG
jgi:hypothetical protein